MLHRCICHTHQMRSQLMRLTHYQLIHSHSFSSSSIELHTQQYPSIKSADPYKTPIVIIHGLLGSSNNWRGIATCAELSHNRHIYGVDVRNHGASPHTDTMRYDEMSNDIINVLDKYKLDQCILIGHSLGGKIAMATALQNESRIKSLIVVDMSPAKFKYTDDESWNSVGRIVDACANVDLDKCKSRDDCDQQLQQYNINDKSIRQFVLQNLVLNHATHKWNWRVNLNTIQKSMMDIVNFDYNDPQQYTYNHPTLFIAGGNSNYIRKSHYELIQQLFTQCEINTIEGAGHWVHIEKKNAFVKMVGDFLDKHE